MISRSALATLLTILGLSLACASAPAGGERSLVRLRLYGTGQRFELASESHTDPVAYYSRVRGDAARKIMPDDVLGALIRELEKLGFERFAQEGRAPQGGSGVIQRSFEIQRGDAFRHWPIGAPADIEEKLEFQELMKVFLSAYNLTESYQAVQNESGSTIFQEKKAGSP